MFILDLMDLMDQDLMDQDLMD